jgi:hypothetical protein
MIMSKRRNVCIFVASILGLLSYLFPFWTIARISCVSVSIIRTDYAVVSNISYLLQLLPRVIVSGYYSEGQ